MKEGKRRAPEMLVAGDFNSKSTVWGRRRSEPRGTYLLDTITKNELMPIRTTRVSLDSVAVVTCKPKERFYFCWILRLILRFFYCFYLLRIRFYSFTCYGMSAVS